MKNIDTEKMIILLIGASEFHEDKGIATIPNVVYNIEELKKALLNEEILGILEENIEISLNETNLQIKRRIIDATQKAANHNHTLFVYYTGHGIVSQQNYSLYLSARNTTQKYLETDGINIQDFRKLIERTRAARKIIIIDACYSGYIHNTMGDLSSRLQSELNKFQGTYVMTSASGDDPALYPPDDTHTPTFFTGKLIDIFNNGLLNNKPYLVLRDIYQEIETDFRNKGGLPLPQQSSFKNADMLGIVKNRAYKGVVSEKIFWEDAMNTDSVEAYENFLNVFPESEYADYAKIQADKKRKEHFDSVQMKKSPILKTESLQKTKTKPSEKSKKEGIFISILIIIALFVFLILMFPDVLRQFNIENQEPKRAAELMIPTRSNHAFGEAKYLKQKKIDSNYQKIIREADTLLNYARNRNYDKLQYLKQSYDLFISAKKLNDNQRIRDRINIVSYDLFIAYKLKAEKFAEQKDEYSEKLAIQYFTEALKYREDKKIRGKLLKLEKKSKIIEI